MWFENGDAPGVYELSKILGPTMLDMVEVMRTDIIVIH
jgi:hypothetical protein